MTARSLPPGELPRWHAERGGLRGLAAAVRDGRLSAADLIRSARNRIGALDDDVHAFTQVFEPAGDAATGCGGPLAGIPVAIKDSIDVAGRVTGLGRPLAERPPAERDAPVVAALRAAGAAVVGKTNLPELASSAVSENVHYGHVRNPADLDRTAGGSSGGSAAAVAAGMVLAALGTDTAGSVLVPAALTGCCGLRPTHGLLDTVGVAPLSPTLDTVGVFAPRPDDLAVVLDALTGAGAGAVPAPDLAGVRIGVLDDLYREAEPAVLSSVDAAMDRLRAAGARPVPVTLPSARLAGQHARAVYLDETARSYARLTDPDRVYAPTVEARRRSGAAADEVTRARVFLPGWRAEIHAALRNVDLLAAPASPIVAPSLTAADAAAELIRFTYPLCFAGVPALTLPCAPPGRLPVGLVLVGRRDADRDLLAVGEAVFTAFCTHPSEARP